MAQSTGTDQGNKFSEKPWLERLLLLMTGSAGGEYDAERAQAIIRVAITCLLLIYLVIMLAVAEHQDSQQFSKLTSSFFTYFFIYFCSSLLLIYWIVRKPGNYTYRRVLTMTMDYGSLTLWMMLGGMVTLPLWAIVLWVTVGNGLRFGHRYLIAATCYAVASLLIVWLFEDYWGANPYVVVTMALTTILVPAYVYGLLTRLQMAHEATIEANQAKSRFLAHASHDLRQPIHAISLYVACLRDEKLSGESRAMVENIDRSLQSVSRLFRSLLDISTLDSGGVKPEFRTIAVNDLLADVINQNKSAIEWSDISLRIIPCSAHVKADGVLLTSMVQNLISNAVKYAPGADILIGCRRRQGRLSIEVHDQGPGITEEHLPHLFEELYRVRKTGDKDIDGVGLGLPIVRRMGELMGLSVTINSTPGRGTVARINDLCHRATRILDQVLIFASTAIIILTLGGLFLSLIAEVVVRYLTQAGLGWPNELPSIIFPWLTMAGAVLAAQTGRHIAVLLVAQKLAAPAARVLMISGAVLAALTFGFLTWHGIKVMQIAGGEVYPVTGLTANIPYAALIFGFVCLSLTALTTIPLILSASDPVTPRGVSEEML